jgi:hypothetical protein
MAEDLTIQYQNRLREANKNRLTDNYLLELSLRLGAVDREGEGMYPTYRPIEAVTDAQIEQMIQDLYEHMQTGRIDVGTSVGIIAAHSISEPITQATLRTFHYAGILTQVSPLAALDTDVGLKHPESITLAIALKPPYNKDFNQAQQLLHSLGRTRLGTYVEVTEDTRDLRLQKFEDNIERIEMSLQEFEAWPIEKQLNDLSMQLDGRKQSLNLLMGKSDNASNQYINYDEKELIDLPGQIASAQQHIAGLEENIASLRQEIVKRDAAKYDGDDYTLQYKALNQEYIDARKEYATQCMLVYEDNSFIAYLKENSTMQPGDLWRCINRQFKEGDGSYRTFGNPDDPLHLIFKNSKVESVDVVVNGKKRGAVHVSFPGLPKGLFSEFVAEMNNIEVCNNCGHPTTLAKMVRKNAKKTSVLIEEPEWDTKTPIDSYYDKVLESLKETGIKPNPPTEDGDSTGLIEVDTSEFDGISFHAQDVAESKRCKNCDHGWIHFDVGNQPDSVRSVMLGPAMRDEKSGSYGPAREVEYNVISSLQAEPFDNHHGRKGAIFQDRPVIGTGQAFRYPGVGFNPGMSTVGMGQSDYPLQHGSEGLWIADPQDNEFFIIALIDTSERLGTRTSGFIGNGGYLGAVKTFSQLHGKLDFERTTCDDVRQVENVLGIEAARSVLFHNLLSTINNAGETHLKHALLLADAMTAHNTILGAPAGRGSVAGMNSQMGNRSEVYSDGTIENYGAVLAQAYERQVQVVLQRAVQGLTDDLEHPKSAQIAAVTHKKPKRGIYSSPSLEEALDAYVDYQLDRKDGKARLDEMLARGTNVDLLEDINSYMEELEQQMNRYSLDKVGFLWSASADGLMNEIPPIMVQRSESHRLRDNKRKELLQDDTFLDMLEEYGGVVEGMRAYVLEYMGLSY